jgi:hypothetical protein
MLKKPVNQMQTTGQFQVTSRKQGGTAKFKRKPFVVPDDIMDEVGIGGTQEFGKCADTWMDSEVGLLRARLPEQYHAVPIDLLRARWITRRKKGIDGYRLSGVGPAKGSRKSRIHVIPEKYRAYLESPDWQARKQKWLDYWKACCLCKSTYKLDVHHNTYERVGHEEDTDCVVLCRKCHDLFHENQSSQGTLDLI